jgi:pimeloyl-ACP methyl ester carboxylesterase
LVIQGQKDEYATAEHCLEISEAIVPPAQTVILDDCGHFPHLEKPTELLALIQEFLITHLKD